MEIITINQKKDKPIGVLDSGLGGLTVVREFEHLLPAENLIYFGDNANCPYGNRSKEEILELTFAMLDFLQDKDVKIVMIACNTISTLIDKLRQPYKFPIVSIIETACEHIASLGLEQIGIFATEFTVKQGLYERNINKLSPETMVFSQPSSNLAILIDNGRFHDPAIKPEVQALLSGIMQTAPDLKNIVLACTHYPIVQEIFEQTVPDITFINPANVQVQAVRTILSGLDLLSEREDSQSHLDIYTSGEKQQYEAAIKKLTINRPLTIYAKTL